MSLAYKMMAELFYFIGKFKWLLDDESVLLSQKLVAILFVTTRNNVTMHLTSILENKLSKRAIEIRLREINILKHYSYSIIIYCCGIILLIWKSKNNI